MKYFFLFLGFFLLSSCKISGNFKGLTSYYEQTMNEKPELFLHTTSVDSLNKNVSNIVNCIFITNGITLKKALFEKEKSVVYIWQPRCNSDICYPLEIIQNFCNENGYSLYIVAEYYDIRSMDVNYNLERNIIGIDTKYYRTNFTSKYLKLFFEDVLSSKEYNSLTNKYLVFENHKFIKDYYSVFDIK